MSAMDSQTPSASIVKRVGPKMLHNIPDLMASMAQLDEDSVQQIRKTAEDPPRVAVYDVLQAVTGCSAKDCTHIYARVLAGYPEVLAGCQNFKFSGRGQRETPVADARATVDIIMVLPGRAAPRAGDVRARCPRDCQ